MVHLSAVGNEGNAPKRQPGRPAADEFDPWDTDKGHEYRVDQFYTRSTNKFDHSKELRANVPTNIHAQVMEIVQNPKFPSIRTNADFIRDAIVHRLRTIHGWVNDPELLKILTIEERRSIEEQDEAEVDDIEHLLGSYEQSLARFTRLSDTTRLRKKVADLEDWAFYLDSPYQAMAERLANEYRKQLKVLSDAST